MTDHDDGLKFKNTNTDGQGKRVRNEIAIEETLKQLLPMEYDDLIAHLSYRMHLCPDTIKYSFLKVYLRIGFIKYDLKTKIVSLVGTESNKAEIQQPKKELTSKCKNCGKPTPDNTTFCSKDCVEQYKAKGDYKP
jgi:hypothetical protein